MAYLKEKTKYMIKNAFKSLGLTISKLQTSTTPILHHEIDLLFDVGANIGQFALKSRQEGYKNRIISFEPLTDAHAQLTKNAHKDQKWTVHERCAVGSATGEITINVSQNSRSSSLLAMLPAHSAAAPDSTYIAKDTAKMVTLDSIFDSYYQKYNKCFLKIDTQGYEAHVLEGAKKSLKHLTGIQLELSLVPLYESQHLYDHFLQFFDQSGFHLWSITPGFTDPNTSQMLQFDATFIRRC